ncbi:MAG: phage tail protein [Methyloprofundus sp.]|nr:phage tail protein [Methyloprofundus sp.]
MSTRLISVDESHIERANRMLHGLSGAAPKALSRALNRSLENARSNAVKKVREEYTVRARDVRQTIRLTRSKPNQLEGEVRSTGRSLPLSAFSVAPKTVNGKRRSPIRVSVRKGSKQGMNRAFVARVGGSVRVFERVGGRRLPIRQLFGPSVPQMIGNKTVVDFVSIEARKTMDVRLDHEIKRILDGADFK